MRQDAFEKERNAFWDAFSRTLVDLEKRNKAADTLYFPERYRRLCRDLALTKERHYSLSLTNRLNALVLRGHRQFYGAADEQSSGVFSKLGKLIAADFPRAVRREWPFVLAAALLFYGSAAFIALLIYIDPSFIYSIMSPQEVAGMESMYDPASTHFLKRRAFDEDAIMFGFYIYNNVGIGFRAFASGLFFGLGPVSVSIYNGLVLGGVAAHLIGLGYTETFCSFVIGHGSLELTAIVFTAAAGLLLGWALLRPGIYSRKEALARNLKRALPIAYGGSLMLVAAAIVEGFWSSSHALTPQIKYAFGGAGWVLVHAYFLFVARGKASSLVELPTKTKKRHAA